MARRMLVEAFRAGQTKFPGLPMDAVLQHVQSSVSNSYATHVKTVHDFAKGTPQNLATEPYPMTVADSYNRLRYLCPYRWQRDLFLSDRQGWLAAALCADDAAVAVSPWHHIGLLAPDCAKPQSVDEPATAPLSIQPVTLGSTLTRDLWEMKLDAPYNPLAPRMRPRDYERSDGRVKGVEPVSLKSGEFPFAMGFLPQTFTDPATQYQAANIVGGGAGRPLKCYVIGDYFPPGSVPRCRLLGAMAVLPPRSDAAMLLSTGSVMMSSPAVPTDDQETLNMVTGDPQKPFASLEWVVVAVQEDAKRVPHLNRIRSLGDLDLYTLHSLVDFARWFDNSTSAQVVPPRDVALVTEEFMVPASRLVEDTQASMDRMRKVNRAEARWPPVTPQMRLSRRAFVSAEGASSLLRQAYDSWLSVAMREEEVEGVWVP
eukprot:TRINITY_DN37446_c0_g1_i1.p1 TRINITY_DN37446_c0_g1~~TRINITY_DN37446_c0_g1_i1.p1  ORF type:complete len:428 (-),score=84.17 TRINITY_DN37446_c0_g1_i1:8-1291(-)